jgi:hypothetical protein
VIRDFLRYAVKWWPLLLIFIGIRMLMGHGRGEGK